MRYEKKNAPPEQKDSSWLTQDTLRARWILLNKKNYPIHISFSIRPRGSVCLCIYLRWFDRLLKNSLPIKKNLFTPLSRRWRFLSTTSRAMAFIIQSCNHINKSNDQRDKSVESFPSSIAIPSLYGKTRRSPFGSHASHADTTEEVCLVAQRRSGNFLARAPNKVSLVAAFLIPLHCPPYMFFPCVFPTSYKKKKSKRNTCIHIIVRGGRKGKELCSRALFLSSYCFAPFAMRDSADRWRVQCIFFSCVQLDARLYAFGWVFLLWKSSGLIASFCIVGWGDER